MLGSYAATQAVARGWEVMATYSAHQVEIPGCTMVQADIRNLADISQVIESFRPEVVINTAAIVKPDLCEQRKSDGFAVNVLGTQNVIAATERVGAHLTHISTDLVFNGEHGPHLPDASPSPVNYYGMTKVAAEAAIMAARVSCAVVRTSIIFGPRRFPHLESFSDKVIESLSAGKPMAAYVDQYRPAVPAWNLADAVLEIADRRLTGVFHVVCPELTTRYQFARRIAQVFELDGSLIEPIYMDASQLGARRPKLLALDTVSTARTLRTPLLTFAEGIRELKKRMNWG